ncbi:1,2-epoxyphenylacetyl-CoA isomerase [Corynebacterium urogenitale]|uniref:1,2-epoxyphenylacetyl-CoA isomerase n=2 Tax=Corynebacterium urogenitale TaxID=2487892 RepID=A0A5J6ZD70_9CORY|nr:1,2-epoxyphenylacetyl-CoA isomerase [Corynebacterium urogenitale]
MAEVGTVRQQSRYAEAMSQERNTPEQNAAPRAHRKGTEVCHTEGNTAAEQAHARNTADEQAVAQNNAAGTVAVGKSSAERQAAVGKSSAERQAAVGKSSAERQAAVGKPSAGQEGQEAEVAVVLEETSDGIRSITINRPEAYNSLNYELRAQLMDAFVGTARDAAQGHVRVVVLKASGKAFCAGQDLKEQLADMQSGTAIGKVVNDYNPMAAALLSIPVPVIASIQGPAAGAGWGLAMACDFRIMSTAGSFKGAFSDVGLTADTGLSATLVHAVGRARALEILLLDEKISAEEAKKLGLITDMVLPAELEIATQKLAQRLAAGPTASYIQTKKLVKDVATVISAASDEGMAQDGLGLTNDHLEAIQAFLDKRAPRFQGN